MNKDEFAARALFTEMQREEKLSNQFDKLRPTLRKALLRNASVIGAFAFLVWVFPELPEKPVLYALLMMIFTVNVEIHNESKKIHDRIDLLHQMIKKNG